MSFDWKKTLATVAPVLATAFGGPMAGVATKMAADALGLNPGATQGDIESAIVSGSPDVLVKLKEADHAFKAEMKRLDVDVKRIDAQDRDSARELAKVKGITPQTVLSIVFIGGFVYVLAVLFGAEKSVADEMMQPAMYLLGILSAGIIQIMNFFFGSSSGSKEKTSELARLVK